MFDISRSFADDEDDNDSLNYLKEKFHHPYDKNRKPVIYFCGNSLGLQPKSVTDNLDNGNGNNLVSNVSNVPYANPQYSLINSILDFKLVNSI